MSKLSSSSTALDVGEPAAKKSAAAEMKGAPAAAKKPAAAADVVDEKMDVDDDASEHGSDSE
jgi:hypothetical protein